MATLESKDAFYVLGFPDGRFSFVIQDGNISVFESRHLLHSIVLNVGNAQRYYSTFYTDHDDHVAVLDDKRKPNKKNDQTTKRSEET
eukprot:1195432-Prorocentrum_minimum.AAC.5